MRYDYHHSYYAYDHGGERRLKLTGANSVLDVNADYMTTYSMLDKPTLYPSAFLVLSNSGYTKHYYAGAERVAARIGGGGLDVSDFDTGLSDKAGDAFQQSLALTNSRQLNENETGCLSTGLHSHDELTRNLDEIPKQLMAGADVDYYLFRNMILYMQLIVDDEPDVYFYHSDHLGSASWITDAHGDAVQHLQYLPYGETFIDQRSSGYHERFTFTGKERDEETGYGYFGARYMDHELMTMWLSVDPMADKYPNVSPYNYCMWDPIQVVDPNGMDTIVFDGDGNFSSRIKADGKHVGRLLDKDGNKRFDFYFVCQQDADRCCSPGSQEEYDIYDRNKLSHSKACPAEEKIPIYRIELIWQNDIISQLKESGACDKSFLPRIGYALRESDGGHLDFDNVNRHNGEWNEQTLYIPMIPGIKYAHNVSNMGNFLWGAAMYKMGISYKDIWLGSNLHALYKHHEFDSRDDQLSIALGYSYGMKTAKSG